MAVRYGGCIRPLVRQKQPGQPYSPSMTGSYGAFVVSGILLALYFLEELALSPLQVFWWQQTLEFWNTIAARPVGSLFHTILLDNIHDAFHVRRGAKNFSSSIATCLQFVGHSMPRGRGVVPVMEVAAIIEALREHLRYALHCPRAAPSAGFVSCTYHQWFRPFSKHTAVLSTSCIW